MTMPSRSFAILSLPARAHAGIHAATPSASRMMLALLALLAVVALSASAGCSSDTVKEPDTNTATGDTADAAADTAAADTAETTDTGVVDVAPDAASDTGATGDAAVEDVPATKCTSNVYCEGALKNTLKPCETAVCEASICQVVPKKGSCCNDSQCDDGSTCTVDKCDLGTNTCENKAKPNCCAGQETFLDVGFEQQSFEEFKAVEGPNNGNVKWSLSNARAHTGKNALYLGNPCKTYDTSMTAAAECAPGAAKKAISSSLSSKEVIIPTGKQAVAHFWIWIQAEKMFTDVLGAGSCQPCKKGQSCVKLPDGDQCVDEYDVVRVFVDSTGATGDPVWISTEIGKTTDGWQHISINLAAFQKPGAASAIKLRWEFSANNANNEFEGVYVDDVVIETLCAGEGTLCDKDNACKDDSNGCTSEACNTFANDKSSGICFYDQTPGCCIAVTDCNDKNDCTVDSCTKKDEAVQGACNHVPDASNVACCQVSQTWADTFESGQIASWQHINTNSKSVKWQHNAQAGANGKASMYFGNGTFTGYDDPSLGKVKGPRGTVCSQPVKINPGTVYNVLNFNLKLQTEWSGQAIDKYKNPPALSDVKLDELRVEVALPTGLELAWSSDAVAGTTTEKWAPIIVSLDQWAGQTVGICFTFDAGDAFGNTEGGAWIDDVEVKVECTKKECSIDDQCKSKCGACEVPSCDVGACICTKKPLCCEGSIDCEDGDKCTADACVDSLCKHELADANCCSDKVGAAALIQQNFEGAKLPSGWKPSKLQGQPPFGSGASYDQTIVWNVTGLKSSTGTGAYSMCFADSAGTYNGGPNVPAGRVTSGAFLVPSNGTTIISFDLFLDTEWSDSPFKVFPFAVDQLVVNVVDTAESDPEKARTLIWDSYDIEGSTKKVWKGVVAEIPGKLAGKTAKIEWYFDAGNANKNVYQGACFDNVLVETLCTKPSCVADIDCKPANVDPCKNYGCAKAAGAFICGTSFKPGAGCCEQGLPALTTENGEGGTLVQWKGSATPVDGAVKWQVVSHKYLVDKKEIYFGNIDKNNYAAGSGKTCSTTPDCSSGETCFGSVGKKVCGVVVKGELLSDTFKLSQDNKKSAQLRFRLYLDVEASFETFEVWVVDEFGVEIKSVWSKNVLADFDPKNLKSVVEKTVQLDAFKTGDLIALKFKFDSVDSSKNEQFEGIFLDELIVEEPCKP